jgi:AraC-like DNA-binding protein
MVGRVDFRRAKYGRELLVDAGWVSSWPAFEQDGRPHRLEFHDLLLVTRGRGVLDIDGVRHRVEPGVIVATLPGQVRRWHRGGVDGACVFFTEDFVSRAFADPRFLEQFVCFRHDRPSPAFRPGRPGVADYLRHFHVMRREIARLPRDVSHKLRAVLYDLLVGLDRAYRRRMPRMPPAPDRLIARFREDVEAGFRSHLKVAEYARQLGLTPGHLTVRCRAGLGRSASRVIRDRLVLEARRQLLYTDTPVASIAEALGFADPSYFTRFFTRETGRSPSAFRRHVE